MTNYIPIEWLISKTYEKRLIHLKKNEDWLNVLKTFSVKLFLIIMGRKIFIGQKKIIS